MKEEKTAKATYWFPAKKYGWGWGFPSSWQGWLVFLLFILSVCILPSFTPNLTAYILSSIGLAVLLIGICYWKGEPTRWRWGNSDKKQ